MSHLSFILNGQMWKRNQSSCQTGSKEPYFKRHRQLLVLLGFSLLRSRLHRPTFSSVGGNLKASLSFSDDDDAYLRSKLTV